jgi:hypothetical protein
LGRFLEIIPNFNDLPPRLTELLGAADCAVQWVSGWSGVGEERGEEPDRSLMQRGLEARFGRSCGLCCCAVRSNRVTIKGMNSFLET